MNSVDEYPVGMPFIFKNNLIDKFEFSTLTLLSYNMRL